MAVSSDGDTVLNTLVHNPGCMSALQNAANREEGATNTPGLIPIPHSICNVGLIQVPLLAD